MPPTDARLVAFLAVGTLLLGCPDLTPGDEVQKYFPHLLGVTLDDRGILAVAQKGRIAYSASGTEWMGGDLGTGLDINDVHFNGSLYVAVGAGGRIYTSKDNVSWRIFDFSAALED